MCGVLVRTPEEIPITLRTQSRENDTRSVPRTVAEAGVGVFLDSVDSVAYISNRFFKNDVDVEAVYTAPGGSAR